MQKLHKAITEIDVLSPPKIYIEKILEAICENLAYSFCTVIQVDAQGKGSMFACYNLPKDYPEKVHSVKVPVLSSPSGEAVETCRVVVVHDPLSEARLAPWYGVIRPYNIKTMVWVPLLSKGQALGTYVLYDTQIRDISEEELQSLEQIGVMVSIAITSNQYVDQLNQKTKELEDEIIERKCAEEALRESEKQYRGIFNAAMDSFLICDFNGNVVEANPQACATYGYSYEELMRLSGKDVVHPDYYHLFEQFLRDVQTTGEFHAESVDVRKDGTPFNIEVRGRMFDYNGEPHLLAVVRDITERRCAEGVAQESEERYRRLVESSDDMIFSVDRAGVFKTAGGMRLREFGLRPEDVVGRSLDDLFGGQDAKRYQERHRQVFENGAAMTYEHPFEFAGKTKTDLTTIYPIKDRRGVIELVGVICRDITARKHAEEALQKAHDKLERRVEDRTAKLAKANEQLKQEIDERKRGEKALQKAHDELERRVEERTAQLSKANKELLNEITDRKHAEQALETQANELEEVNSALRVLLKRRDEDKRELEEKVLFNVKELVVPYVEKVKKSPLDARQMACLTILESNLNDIISPFSHRLSHKYLNLTPAEIQVANLVKQGKTSKEIAELLNLSTRTIESHRKNIRKKTGIKNTKANLRTQLLSIQ